MSKIRIRHLVIISVFVISLIFFSVFFNQGTTDMTMEMKKASLPTVNILLGGKAMNTMHGYVDKMELNTIRESITPLEENRSLTFQIMKYGQDIQDISYEVRDVSAQRLIENTKVTNYSEDRESISATVNIKDLIEANKEYNFVLIVNGSKSGESYFTTRIIQKEETNLNEKIDFVLDFHNKTLNKEQVKELTKYMEPSAEGNNTSFGAVNIHSSIKQLGYGDMKVTQKSESKIIISEIDKETGSIILNTLVEVQSGKVKNLYFVNEFFRIRYGTERIYLLAYERNMEECFEMEKSSFANNKIVLGIQRDDIQMMESDGGSILAFVNSGRIFSYNVAENKFASLYSFFDNDNFDDRTLYRQSDIKILNVEENGNVSFMVYGYFNRGMHEGEVGVDIYYFNSVLNTVEEQIFIPYNKSAQMLMKDLDFLSFVNKNDILYAYLDGTLYEINISKKTCNEIVYGLNEENFHVSKNNQMAVWQADSKLYQNKSLVLFDLTTQKRTDIKCKSNEYIHTLGFLNEDVIYGIADIDDVFFDPMGEITFPMKEIIIQSQTGEILKRYSQENIFVTDGTIEENQISLARIQKNEETGSYHVIENDQITSNIQKETGVNHMMETVTDLYETIFQIELKNEIDTKSLKFLTPKEVMFEGGRRLSINEKKSADRYYLYAYGKLYDISSKPQKIVNMAYDTMGVVFDKKGDEIYRRGELSVRNQIMAIKEESITDEKNAMAVCLDTILKYEGFSKNTEYMLERGDTAYDILSGNMRNAITLNLTGCVMDSMLYYVNKDIPVLARLKDGTTYLIIGFNQQNTVLMDPKTGTIYKKGMNDSREMFQENGNQFITYVRNENDVIQ